MLPKKVKKRASLLAIILFTSVIGIFLILNALNKNILYFNSPTDIKINQNINFDRKIANFIDFGWNDIKFRFIRAKFWTSFFC